MPHQGDPNIVITSDFKEVANTTPFEQLKAFLTLFNAKLHIVNVDKEAHVEERKNTKPERQS